MHMISALVAEQIEETLVSKTAFDPARYAENLNGLPADWPPPSELGL
jgi:hypothetical protein